MFSDEFISKLPTDPYEAAMLMCEQYFKSYGEFSKGGHKLEHYDDFIDAYAAMEIFINANGLPIDNEVTLRIDQGINIDNISSFFANTHDELKKKVNDIKLNRARQKFAKQFGGVFLYEFSDGDLATIQRLLNELRDIITKSELFDAKHKQRILGKLEKLQSELHKKMTTLAKIWDLIGEAGVVLGKFGKDAKPFVDRIREIAQIAWRTQARAEELPSGTTLPLLSDAKKEDD
jgi:hypothetical protein